MRVVTFEQRHEGDEGVRLVNNIRIRKRTFQKGIMPGVFIELRGLWG